MIRRPLLVDTRHYNNVWKKKNWTWVTQRPLLVMSGHRATRRTQDNHKVQLQIIFLLFNDLSVWYSEKHKMPKRRQRLKNSPSIHCFANWHVYTQQRMSPLGEMTKKKKKNLIKCIPWKEYVVHVKATDHEPSHSRVRFSCDTSKPLTPQRDVMLTFQISFNKR